MVNQRRWAGFLCLIFILFGALPLRAEQAGSIRGTVYDKDFETPLTAVQVLIAETGQVVTTGDEGNYLLNQVSPATYTLVFSRQGYSRQVKADVIVAPGQLTELNVWLSGDFTEMEEFIVQDFSFNSGSEAALLKLRMESPSLLDSISSNLMSQAGASDAASALKLVAGATVQEGKYAVIRGLPDRYVNSQMNGVRLPTADAEKRAVQLDQFPAVVIESIQVSKTFTPDQQGDASGGAVNLVLKGIPEKNVLNFSTQYSFNNQTTGINDFLSYRGGGVNCLGTDNGTRDMLPSETDWNKPVGIVTTDAPIDYKWSLSGGGKHVFQDFTLGGFASFFYERSSSYFDDGIEDKYWVDVPGGPMTPQYSQGAPAGADEKFMTSLFDVKQAVEELKWGSLGMIGIENENNKLSFLFMYTKDVEDKTTLTENTRGKKLLNKYWPDNYGPEFRHYDPYDPDHPGNQSAYKGASPYRRNETLQYTERTTQTMQLSGHHILPDFDLAIDKFLTFDAPEIDWVISHNRASLDQPDKRLFATTWAPISDSTGIHGQYRTAETINLGNIQHLWKNISEQSNQASVNAKFPFEQWTENDGYLKMGSFYDRVDREYFQESFSNFTDYGYYPGRWDDYWSAAFPSEEHYIAAAEIDVDYDGQQKISAWYYMADLPLCSFFNIIGGTRYETTELGIINHPESKVEWYPTDTGPVQLNPGDADVDFEQNDILPSIGFTFTPWKPIKLRGSYSETVARQTFKELSPIKQQEFLGSDLFIGNPNLQMSALKNYDLRLDYTPYDGGLVSLSYFLKEVDGPIEYVQKAGNGFTFTKPINYPTGELNGFEIEIRQQMKQLWNKLDGLTLGANATFIDSEVILPKNEAYQLKLLKVPQPKRDMTNAPEYLYNLYLTHDWKKYGGQFGIFYTVRGDTLIAGSGFSTGSFIPSIYETAYGTLNISYSQKIKDIWNLKFQVKNLLNPKIESVYRSDYINGDVTKASYQKGMEFSISLSATF